MKQSILILVLVVSTMSIGLSQVKTPQPSPSVKIEQAFGLSTVTLEYSRPSVKERTVFGDLVPYDKMWRTGANKNTMVTFSDAVSINGTEIEAGTYALFMKPSMNMWDVYFYTDTENWGTPEEWDESKVAAKTSVKPSALSSSVETMHIGLENMTISSADLVLDWDKTSVSIPLTTSTDEMVLSTIEKTMEGPSAGDYYNAARYYRENDKDLTQALSWMNTAIQKRGETFWNVRQLALLQADMGDYKSAITTAKKSLELSKAAEYDSYIKANEESIAEWKKMK